MFHLIFRIIVFYNVRKLRLQKVSCLGHDHGAVEVDTEWASRPGFSLPHHSAS